MFPITSFSVNSNFSLNLSFNLVRISFKKVPIFEIVYYSIVAMNIFYRSLSKAISYKSSGIGSNVPGDIIILVPSISITV
jgi:hypothetical protein